MTKNQALFEKVPEAERGLPINLVLDGALGVAQQAHAFFAVARNQGAFDGALGCACSSRAQGFFEAWCSHADFHDDSSCPFYFPYTVSFAFRQANPSFWRDFFPRRLVLCHCFPAVLVFFMTHAKALAVRSSGSLK